MSGQQFENKRNPQGSSDDFRTQSFSELRSLLQDGMVNSDGSVDIKIKSVAEIEQYLTAIQDIEEVITTLNRANLITELREVGIQKLAQYIQATPEPKVTLILEANLKSNYPLEDSVINDLQKRGFTTCEQLAETKSMELYNVGLSDEVQKIRAFLKARGFENYPGKEYEVQTNDESTILNEPLPHLAIKLENGLYIRTSSLIEFGIDTYGKLVNAPLRDVQTLVGRCDPDDQNKHAEKRINKLVVHLASKGLELSKD